MNRDEAISRIKAGLKKRSGNKWSVTGGRGTAWGWSWGPWRCIKGPPVLYRTKREAVASFEAYHTILLDKLAGRL